MSKRSPKRDNFNRPNQQRSAERTEDVVSEPRAQHGQQHHAAQFELPLSLSQLNPQAMPVLIPVASDSSIDQIVEQVRTAGAAHVELLVPDGLNALRSLAGCELLSSAANEAGVSLTFYVADRQIARVLRRVGFDIVHVDGQITVPSHVGWSQQKGVRSTQRPAFNDQDWEVARRELDATIEGAPSPDEVTDDIANYPWQQPGVSPEPPPSLFGAFLNKLPGRNRRASSEAAIEPPLMRPTMMPKAISEEPQQVSGSAWLMILVCCLALAVAGGLIWYGLGGDLPWRFGGAQPPVIIQAPLKEIPPITLADFAVPLAPEPTNESSSTAIRGLQLATPVTVTVEGSATGTTVTPVGNGRGLIALINRSPQPITIPAGTTIQAGGQEFAFEEEVFVPGLIERADLSGTDYGVAHAPLRARTTGPAGNVPAGTITSLPPELSAGIELEVHQWEPFSGGSTIEEPTVLSDDVKKVLPQALDQLHAQGVRELQNEVAQQAGFAMLEDSITPTREMLKDLQPKDYKVSPPIGKIAKDGKFTLELSQTFEALAEPTDQPIKQQLEQAVAEHVRQAQGVAVESVQVDAWQRDGQRLVVDASVVPSPQVVEVSADLVAQIQAAVAAQPRAKAEQYLEELKTSGAIGDFQLPPDWKTVPRDAQIDVVGPEVELDI